MSRVLPAILSVAMASAALGPHAWSADMPHEYVNPVPPPGLYNWTGFYAGGHGGYGAGRLGTGLRGGDIDGWFTGGQIGWNWQNRHSPWVFGTEFDAAFARIERDVDFANGNTVTSAFSEISSLGTARARVGYAIDRMLVYGTGGVAWAKNTIGLYTNPNQLAPAATSANTHVGFAVGAGFEWALSRSWTMKFEYLYNDLGSENYFRGTIPTGINADLRFSTGKVGLNYVFDWGRGYIGPKY